MPGSRLMITTGPSKPYSGKVAAAVPPALPPPRITIGLVPVPLALIHRCGNRMMLVWIMRKAL
jgi:hypothetical protein